MSRKFANRSLTKMERKRCKVGLIDADALCAEIDEYVYPITTNNLMGAADAYFRIKHLIEQAPTIEARPVVRGEWEGDGMYMTCPNCGAMFDEDDLVNSILLFGKTGCDKSACNFCGNCGADMRGAGNG